MNRVVLALTSLLAVAAAANMAHAQSLTVRITHVNNFEGAYDRANHTYRAERIRDLVLDPRTRPIEAVGCGGLPLTRIPQESTEDGNPPQCEDRLARVAPPGVTAVRWTLRGPHPISNSVVDLTTVTRELGRLRPIVGSNCIPIEAPLVLSPEDCTFKISPSTASKTAFPPRYTVRQEVINSTNEVLRSGSAEVSVPRQVPLIVSVGDSLASGEGNPDRVGSAKPDQANVLNPNGRDCKKHTTFMMAKENKPDMLRDPVWFDSRDHRSMRSAPAEAARGLLSEWPYIVFLSFAKSGSEITAEDSDDDLLEQLEHVQQVVGDHKIDALLISIGGNDVGFVNTLEGLTLGDRFGGLSALTQFTENLLELRGMREAGQGYPLINETIDQLQLNVSNILINEYPGSLFNVANNEPAEGCGVFKARGGAFLTISRGEAQNINDMGILLNAEVKLAASINGWRLVDEIAEKFESRGYCASSSLFVGAQESCDQQGDFDGTMHPKGLSL